MTTYARIHRLAKPRGGDVDHTFEQLAKLLRNSGKTAIVRCTILSDGKRRSWTFDLQGKDCRLSSDVAGAPNLEIITREKTWWEIADGNLSPLEAFTGGRLRILGDTELGSHLLRQIADRGDATQFAGSEAIAENFVETIGRVQFLKIQTEFGVVRILREQRVAGYEHFFIWYNDQSRGPRTLFTAELSKALSSGLLVSIRHGEDSAYISQLTVFAPLNGAMV